MWYDWKWFIWLVTSILSASTVPLLLHSVRKSKRLAQYDSIRLIISLLLIFFKFSIIFYIKLKLYFDFNYLIFAVILNALLIKLNASIVQYILIESKIVTNFPG